MRRTYLAKVAGVPRPEQIDRLLSGVRLEDGRARALDAAVQSRTPRNTWVRVVVSEGRPHLVKRLMEAVGAPVLKLHRADYGGVGVQGLRPGDYREVQEKYRPSHADYTYDAKYGVRDWRGGGRTSARETAGRVAAGAIARKLLAVRWNVVVADQGVPRSAQPSGEIDEQPELIVGGVLHVVADELHEVGPDQAVRLLDHPQRRAVIVRAGLGQVQVAWDHHDDGSV